MIIPGMGGMPPGPQCYGMDMGAAPLPVAAPSMSGSEPPARPNMASGDGGSTKIDGRPAAPPTFSAGLVLRKKSVQSLTLLAGF